MKTNFFLSTLSLIFFFSLISCENEKPEKELLDLNLHFEDQLVVSLVGDDFDEIYLEGLCLDNEPFTKTGNVTILKYLLIIINSFTNA